MLSDESHQQLMATMLDPNNRPIKVNNDPVEDWTD